MRKIFLALFIFILPVFSQVIITEVMYDLVGSDSPNEFFEIYNKSTTTSVDLTGWKISDKFSTDDLIDTGDGLIISPLGYGIVLEDDYDIATGIYNGMIPAGTIKIKVDDSSIGNGLAGSDSLYLEDSGGTIVDFMGWADPAVDGYSLEKVRLNLPNTTDNWLQSKNLLGTPGAQNSNTPLAIDGAIVTSSTLVSPGLISPTETTNVSVSIANRGLNPFSGSVEIKHAGSVVGTAAFGPLAALATIDLIITAGPFTSGKIDLDIELNIAGDLDLSNNTDNAIVDVRYSQYEFLINEFLATPDIGQVEFVELIHRGVMTIDLKDWRIADNRDGTSYRFPAILVNPGDFVIIAADSSLYPSTPPGTHYLIPSGGFPSLNNSGDEVRIFDPYNTKIDSLNFSGWNMNTGTSFEKISPELSSEPMNHWRLSASGLGMTPGSDNSVLGLNINGALSNQISFTPLIPEAGETITALVSVSNIGLEVISGTVTAEYKNNVIGSTNAPLLIPGQSQYLQISLPSFSSGNHEIIFYFNVVNDGNLLDNTINKRLSIAYETGTIKLNEFLASPNSDQIEFIELVSNESFIMADWIVSDNTMSNKLLPLVYVNKGDYIIIAADTSMRQIANPNAHYIIPFGGFPSLNNSGDAIYLKDAAGAIIDSLVYTSSWPMENGYSTEKLRPNLPSNNKFNWAISYDAIGITPGYENSVYLSDFDGAIIAGEIHHAPESLKSNEAVQLSVPITNLGAIPISGSIVVSSNSNVIGSVNFTDLAHRNTFISNIELPAMGSGMHLLKIELIVDGDQSTDNNIAEYQIDISYEFGDVLINEFLPRPTAPQAEFVELISFTDVNLDGWSIKDETAAIHSFDGGNIVADNFIVLSEDPAMATYLPNEATFVEVSNFPTLNNYGDAIYLFDHTGVVIDSLIYTTYWNLATGKSTEKIHAELASNDSTNWQVSVDSTGMTPGRANSIIAKDFDGLIVSEGITHTPKFPKSTDWITLTIPITNIGLQSINGAVTVSENNSSLNWDVFSKIYPSDTTIVEITIPPLSSGYHNIDVLINILETGNSLGHSVSTTILVSYNFGMVTINEFLPRPTSPQAEFVELISFTDVNLDGWSIKDETTTIHSFDGGNIVADNFIVLSEDPAMATYLPNEATFVEVSNFPTLNNYGDAIYLFDHTGVVIDSLIYTTYWNLATGKSTEKIHAELTSNDSTNWLVSVDSTGMTPGRANSVLAKDFDGAIIVDDIVQLPVSPESSETILLTVPITNNGLQPISGTVAAEENGVELDYVPFNNLATLNTVIVELEIQPLASGYHNITISLDIVGDENIADNTAMTTVLVSYDFGMITFNEFLPDPVGQQAEFIELFAHSAINLDGWSINDATKSNPKSFSAGDVSTGAYIVLSDDTTLAALLPAEAIFAEVRSFPSLNNSGDAIYLYDITGKMIDSLHYNNSWQLDEGISTEKLRPEFTSDDAGRWQLCTNPTGTTWGAPNSILMNDIDGAIIGNMSSHAPLYPYPNESVAFSVAVANAGLNIISGSISAQQDGDELATATFNNLASEDTTIINFNIEPLPSGQNHLKLELSVAGDLNTVNNTLDYSIDVSYSFGAVMFNEFMSAPDTDQAEFVEIVSFSNLDLSGWSISDNTFKQYYFGEFTASANQPVVIAADSVFIASLTAEIPILTPTNGIPTLNNSSDGIYLFDLTGAVIDSLVYDDETWPLVDGRSTEKFRPEFLSNDFNRWGTAVNAAAMTPGEQNSLHFKEIPGQGNLEFAANPFSPDGDGVDDELLIQYKLPYEQAIIKLEIFDIMGRSIAAPYWNVHFPQEGLLKWDGKRSDDSIARIGIYIVKISAKDTASGSIWEKIETVVLAKKL